MYGERKAQAMLNNASRRQNSTEDLALQTRARSNATTETPSALAVRTQMSRSIADAQNHLGHARRQQAAKGALKPIKSRVNNLIARTYMTSSDIRAANAAQSEAAKFFKEGGANAGAIDDHLKYSQMRLNVVSEGQPQSGTEDLALQTRARSNAITDGPGRDGMSRALGAALLLGPGKRHYESRDLNNEIKAKALKRAQKGRDNYTEIAGFETKGRLARAFGFSEGIDKEQIAADTARAALDKTYFGQRLGDKSHYETSKYFAPFSYNARKKAFSAQFATAHRKEGEELSDAAQSLIGDHEGAFKAEKRVEKLETNINRFNLAAKGAQRTGELASAGFSTPLGYVRKALAAVGWAYNSRQASATATKFSEGEAAELAQASDAVKAADAVKRRQAQQENRGATRARSNAVTSKETPSDRGLDEAILNHGRGDIQYGDVNFRAQTLGAKSEQNKARSRVYATKAVGSIVSGLYSWSSVGPQLDNDGLSFNGVERRNFTQSNAAQAQFMGTDGGEENRSTGTRIINAALEKGVKEPLKSGAKKASDRAQYSWLQRNVRHKGHIQQTTGKQRVAEEGADALANLRGYHDTRVVNRSARANAISRRRR